MPFLIALPAIATPLIAAANAALLIRHDASRHAGYGRSRQRDCHASHIDYDG